MLVTKATDHGGSTTKASSPPKKNVQDDSALVKKMGSNRYHVRTMSNSGTLSTHPTTTIESSQSFLEGDRGPREEAYDDPDEDVEPEPNRKIILHKKRASRHAKEYDDDGNTIIKPMKSIELSSDEKSHASSISECSTSSVGSDDDSPIRVSRSRRRQRQTIRDVDGGGAAKGEECGGGVRSNSRVVKDRALLAIAGAKGGAKHVAALSMSVIDEWGKKGGVRGVGRKWQSALFV